MTKGFGQNDKGVDESTTKHKNNTMLKKDHNYFVYMVTNPKRTVLYTGMTNDLKRRLQEHIEAREKENNKSFTGKYFAYNLVWYEWHQYVNDAIAREKQIKKWRRDKKEFLIAQMNPEWKFLNNEVKDWDI